MADATKTLNATVTKSTSNGIQVSIPEQQPHFEKSSKIFGLAVWKPHDEPTTITIHNVKPRLSHSKHLAIQTMRKNGIIKKADKGQTIVYMSKADYAAMGLKHLDTSNYQRTPPVNFDQLNDKARRIKQECQSTAPKLYNKLRNLNIKGTRTRRIYFLPKVHKGRQNDGLFKGRPIVDAKLTPLASLDKACATFLKPLTNHIGTTVMKDSIEVLKQLRNPSNHNSTFLGMDVEDLYTNVPIDEAIDATLHLAEQVGLGTNSERNIIAQLLQLALHNNFFVFQDQWWHQRHGIPMGSNSAPILADVWLFSLEIKHLDDWKRRGLTCLLRYRDDILAICPSLDLANQIRDEYNALHPSIKVTADISTEKTEFLDIRIARFPDRSLRLGVFFKQTDSLQPIAWSSDHTTATLRSTVYGRALRTIRISNNEPDYWTAFESFMAAALKAGYPASIIYQQWTKAAVHAIKTPWPHFSTKRHTEDDDKYKTNHVLLYNRNLTTIYQVIKKRRIRHSFHVGKKYISRLSKTADS